MSKSELNKRNIVAEQLDEAEEIADESVEQAEAEENANAAEQTEAEETASDAEQTANEDAADAGADRVDDADSEENADSEKDAEVEENADSEEDAESEENVDSEEDDASEDKPAGKVTSAVEADVRKEAARVAKNKHEREKAGTSAEIIDERREARHKRRVRNTVVAYVVVAVLILAIVCAAVLVVFKYGRKNPTTNPNDGVIAVTEPTEQTEDIINDMLGMEDDISEPVVENPEPEVVPEPEPDLLGEYVNSVIESMTLEDKVAGIFMVTPESITGATVATIAGDATSRALDKYAVGGIVYSGKNISNKDQFSTLIEKTAAMVKNPTFFAFAEEGGTFSNLANAGYYTAEDSAVNIGATGDVTNAYSAGVTIGFAMREIGLNVNLAPVADISTATDNILGARIYSENAGEVLAFSNEMMRGIEDGNVTACVKYFPGLGMISENPENGRVVSERTDEEFSESEFLVYQNLIENGANMIMMSNVVYTAYSDIPASLSEEIVTGILRNRLGYDGIILSGNLSELAISQYYGSDEAAIAALKAGCDMIMCPEDFEAAYEGILQAVNDGVIDEKRIDNALERILRVKYAE